MMDLEDDRQALLFTAHHLIVDRVSWKIILDDFLTILKQLETNEEVKLPMKIHSFKEWSKALQDYSKRDFSGEIDYWKSILDKKVNCFIDYGKEKDIVKTSNVLSMKLNEETLNHLTEKINEIYKI